MSKEIEVGDVFVAEGKDGLNSPVLLVYEINHIAESATLDESIYICTSTVYGDSHISGSDYFLCRFEDDFRGMKRPSKSALGEFLKSWPRKWPGKFDQSVASWKH